MPTNRPIPNNREDQTDSKPLSRSSSAVQSLQKHGSGNSDKAESKPSSIKSITTSGRNTPDRGEQRKEVKYAQEAYGNRAHVVRYEQGNDTFILDRNAIIVIRNLEHTIKTRINEVTTNKSLKVKFDSDKEPFNTHRRWDAIINGPRFDKFPNEMDADEKEQLCELAKHEINFLRTKESQLEWIYATRRDMVAKNSYFEPLDFTMGTRPANSTVMPMDKKSGEGTSKRIVT